MEKNGCSVTSSGDSVGCFTTTDHIQDELIEQVNKFGRFTVVTLTNDNKDSKDYQLRGTGISRCSQLDGFKDIVGLQIARSRAKSAYYKKRAKKALRNWYEG